MKKAFLVLLALLISVAFVSTGFAQIKGAKEEAAPARTTPGKAAPAGTPEIKGGKPEATPARTTPGKPAPAGTPSIKGAKEEAAPAK